jgi:hypothetical protein
VRARAWAPPAASALIYTVITAILGRGVLAHIGTAIANDPGDPLLTAAILHWNAHHVPWSDAWWQFPIYYPARDALAFSEHLLGLSVIASPIAWITGSPLITYNLTTLLTFPLCATAMYALVHRLTRNAPAAFLAGLAYGFAPYRMSNLPHIQMLASFWAPLALLGLHSFLEAAGPPAAAPALRDEKAAGPPAAAPTLRDEKTAGPSAAGPALRDLEMAGLPIARGQHRDMWAGFRDARNASSRTRLLWLSLYGAAWALQAAANGYMIVFFSVLVGLWVCWFVVPARNWRALATIAAATVVAALPLTPIIYKYVTVHAYHGFERNLAEVRDYSADVAAVVCAPAALTFWGWIRVACRAEGELFPGVALAAIVAGALVYTLRSPARSRGGEPPPLRLANAFDRRPLVWIRRVLIGVATLFALIVAAVLVLGPLRLDVGFVHLSASGIGKPLLVALTAAVAALLLSLGRHAFRQPASTLSFYLFAAVVTWLLALGPTITLMGDHTGRPGPFALIQSLPGVAGLRVPARFWLMTMMCLTIAAGIFVADILRRMTRWKGAVAVVFVALTLLADGWIPRIAVASLPPSVPDPASLRDQVVLQLPIDLYSDVASAWRAATGGWTTVNGYSGFGPNYYGALMLASQSAEDALFPPFRSERDLHVVVADDATALKDAVERQPGVVFVARGHGSSQYRLPRRALPPAARDGEPVPIASARSNCASAAVTQTFDRDERSVWVCSKPVSPPELTIDLDRVVPVSSVDYSLGLAGIAPSQLLIETSTDGVAWIEARRGSILAELIAGGLREPKALRAALPFPARAARHVRIRPIAQPDDFVWFVAEIAVRRP